jgi:hypothetical protein
MTNTADAEENALPDKEEDKSKVQQSKSDYQKFLDSLRHASANQILGEVRDFVDAFSARTVPETRLQAATKFHDFLSATVPKLLATTAFAEATSEEARVAAADGFEKFVVTKLHKVLFRSLPEDARQDELVENKLQEKQKSPATSLVESLTDESKGNFDLAVDMLKKVDQYKAPTDKVVCMLNAYRLTDSISEELRTNGWKPLDEEDTSKAGDQSPGGGCDNSLLSRVLEALLIEALPPNLFSNIEFAAAFRHPPRLTSEERRCLNEFSAALLATTGCTAKVPMAVIGAGGTWGSFEELPPWLVDSGVTFRFESVEAGNLRIEEVDELLVAYQRMADVLQSLTESPPLAK